MAIVLIAVGVTVSAILDGWVLSILWGWFFVPILDMPPISTIQAIGIALVVTFLTGQYVKNEDDTYGALAWTLARPFLVLGIGWIVHANM
jgi:hypothetical protein